MTHRLSLRLFIFLSFRRRWSGEPAICVTAPSQAPMHWPTATQPCFVIPLSVGDAHVPSFGALTLSLDSVDRPTGNSILWLDTPSEIMYHAISPPTPLAFLSRKIFSHFYPLQNISSPLLFLNIWPCRFMCHLLPLAFSQPCFLSLFPRVCIHVLLCSLFFNPADGESRFLRNFTNFLPDYTASHPRRQYSSKSPPWEPKISHGFIFILSVFNFLCQRMGSIVITAYFGFSNLDNHLPCNLSTPLFFNFS
jgi:hypothetical protein